MAMKGVGVEFICPYRVLIIYRVRSEKKDSKPPFPPTSRDPEMRDQSPET